MTVKFVHDLMFAILNKNGGQGDISTDEFNNYINQAQYSYQSFLMGQLQQYRPARPIPTVDYSMNENARQRLTKLIPKETWTIPSNGIYSFPTYMIRVDAMVDIYNNPIRFIAQDKKGSILNSVIDVISNTNAAYTLEDTFFQFYPTTLGSAIVNWIKKAPEIKYAVTLDGNGREIYDVTNSIDPIWYDTDCEEIIVRALAMIGVPLQLQQVQMYAKDIKTNGQ